MEDRVTGGHAALAFLLYLPAVGVPFLLIALVMRSRSRFLRYHTFQALYLFSVFLALVVVLLGLFYVFNSVLDFGPGRQVLAVLVVMAAAAYLGLAILMAVSSSMKKMVMLPVLGELAGER